jgi:hypothetical protein
LHALIDADNGTKPLFLIKIFYEYFCFRTYHDLKSFEVFIFRKNCSLTYFVFSQNYPSFWKWHFGCQVLRLIYLLYLKCISNLFQNIIKVQSKMSSAYIYIVRAHKGFSSKCGVNKKNFGAKIRHILRYFLCRACAHRIWRYTCDIFPGYFEILKFSF